MKKLTVGDIAPLFLLKDQNGESISLKSFIGDKRVVLYFYPKALTPGCTLQAEGIRDIKTKLAEENVVVFGISADTCEKLQSFTEKKELNFSLLSDPDHIAIEKYGVWGEKKFMGKSYMGILRQTFLIGLDGRIEAILDQVKTKTHHVDLLKVIRKS